MSGRRRRVRRRGARVADEHVFRREGDYWSVAFAGQTVRLRDLKGVRYLARLLADPGREFHVLDLVAGERGGSGDASRSAERGLAFSSGLDAGVVLDAQAKEAYRRRLAEIEEDIEEARAMGDDERAAQAAAERDFLVRELARAVGLGGRDRRVGSASERARASVTRAIRQAMARIHELPSHAGGAPGPRHPHRHLLRLPARSADARGLEALSLAQRSAGPVTWLLRRGLGRGGAGVYARYRLPSPCTPRQVRRPHGRSPPVPGDEDRATPVA